MIEKRVDERAIEKLKNEIKGLFDLPASDHRGVFENLKDALLSGPRTSDSLLRYLELSFMLFNEIQSRTCFFREINIWD
jgi:hypothetical protein